MAIKPSKDDPNYKDEVKRAKKMPQDFNAPTVREERARQAVPKTK